MNVLTSYIVKEILKGSLVAMLLLITLFNLFTLSDELDDIGKGSYGLKEVFYYIALKTPTIFYELMPASALLGSLFTLGAMGNNRELIAMRAAGLSVFGIIRVILLAGVMLAAMAIGVGEFVAPAMEQEAQTMRATAQNKALVMSSQYGIWLREGKKFINVRQIEDNGDLSDISIYELDDQQHLLRSTHANKAIFLGNQRWTLQQLKQSDISTRQILARAAEEQSWTSSIEPDLLKIVVVNPNNLSLYDLAMYVSFLKENHQKAQKFELAFWGRVVNPLVIFVMLLVSAPFVIGVKRGINAGARILIGVIIGMGFNVLDMTVSHIGLINDFNPPLVAFIPSVVVAALALVAVRQVR
ncbi:MAG: LPS export ABC transporter permease LptG [Methylovulum sp.]